VFCNLNSSMEALRGIVRQNPYLALSDNVAVIDFFIDEVNGAAGHTFAGDKRLFPSFESGKLWQQRWMNV